MPSMIYTGSSLLGGLNHGVNAKDRPIRENDKDPFHFKPSISAPFLFLSFQTIVSWLLSLTLLQRC